MRHDPPPPITFDDRLYTIAQVARRFGTTPAAVHRWRQTSPGLPVTKVGNRYVTSVAAIDWYLSQRQPRRADELDAAAEADGL